MIHSPSFPSSLAIASALALSLACSTASRAEQAPSPGGEAPKAVAPAAGAPSTDSGNPAPTGTPAAPATRELPAPGFAALSWLEGCWQGSINKRDFREVWLPARGGMMLGVSQTVSADKTVDYEYLRIEPRSDGVYYVVSPPGKAEDAFKLSAETVDPEDVHTFQFTDPAREFPSRIGYRRGKEGWLYTEVQGKVGGKDRLVIYPLRRVSCESGELITR